MQNHNRASGRTRVNGSGARIKSLSPKRKGFAHQAKYLVYVPRAAGQSYYQQTSRYLLPGIELQQKVFLRHSLAKADVDSGDQLSTICASLLTARNSFLRESAKGDASLCGSACAAPFAAEPKTELPVKNVNNYIKRNHFHSWTCQNFYFLRCNKWSYCTESKWLVDILLEIGAE